MAESVGSSSVSSKTGMSGSSGQSGRRRGWMKLAVGIALSFALLAIPEGGPEEVPTAGHRPFEWGKDSLWEQLERDFSQRRGEPCSDDFEMELGTFEFAVKELSRGTVGLADPRWDSVVTRFFSLSSTAARCSEHQAQLLAFRDELRRAAKAVARSWEGQEGARRDFLYKVLYGTRAAVEELLLQLPPKHAPELSGPRSIPSATPSVELFGVRIHSGDLLLSRGGAPTSAFIARGNDYPGNFSHVALVHVDERSGEARAIEAHIERGVAISGAEDYLRDKKLRIAVLRLRPELAEVKADPMLPHRVASRALTEVQARHIPYDFEMDVADDERQFCSEVASSNYRAEGIELWESLSTFSSPGLARWMTRLGVRNMETHAPSDLEYDLKLAVVAEWHDSETLLRDHIDNAVIDAMLEGAESGVLLGYSVAALPWRG